MWKNKVVKPINCYNFLIPVFAELLHLIKQDYFQRMWNRSYSMLGSTHSRIPKERSVSHLITLGPWQVEFWCWEATWETQSSICLFSERCAQHWPGIQWVELDFDPVLTSSVPCRWRCSLWGKELWDPRISKLERTLKFILPETFILLTSKMSWWEVEHLRRS